MQKGMNQSKFPSSTSGNERYQNIQAMYDSVSLSALNFAERAENIIKRYMNIVDYKEYISTTQLRALFSLLTEVREYVRMQNNSHFNEEMQGRIQYIKMRFAYAAGRKKEKNEKEVKVFMQLSGLMDCLDTIKDSVKQFELVCKYMEALVAYHKYYIGG